MRILHILDHSPPLLSGYAIRTQSILREQRARGWETLQVTSSKHPGVLKDGRYLLVEEVEGYLFYRTPVVSGMMWSLPVANQWAVIRGLSRRLQEIVPAMKPDILHAHSPVLNGIAALRASRRFGLPLVYEVRAFWEDAAVDQGSCREGDLRYRTTKALETHLLNRADAVTCICEGLRGDILTRGIPADKVAIIPNGADSSNLARDATPDQSLADGLGLNGKQVIGFVGSFFAYEGLSMLLQSLPAILAAHQNIRLLLVGGGLEEQNLKEQAHSFGIQDKVVFCGRVPHNHVDRYYDLIDLLVYPRLSKRLTELVTPLKPLEAMAKGRLVLASDVGGHRELIRDGFNGWLFRADDPNDLVNRLLGVFKMRERWPTVRAAAQKYIREDRNWKSSVACYEGVYHKVLAGPR